MSLAVFARWTRIPSRAPSASPASTRARISSCSRKARRALPGREALTRRLVLSNSTGIQHSQEHLITSAARQQRAELDVRVDVPLGRVDEGLHPGQLAAHLPHVHLPGPLGGEAGDLDLQDLAYLQ